MKHWMATAVALLVLAGCKGLKDQQLGAYVGDSQTKVVYKNVGGAGNKIPDARRVYFRGVEQATDAGYTLSNMATGGDAGGKDE